MHMPESIGGGGYDIYELAHVLKHIYSHGFNLNFHINENVQGPHLTFMALPEDLQKRICDRRLRANWVPVSPSRRVRLGLMR